MYPAMSMLGRVMIAVLFIVSGIGKIMRWSGTLGYMQSKGLPATEVLLVLTIVLELGAGLGLLFDRLLAPAALLLAAFCLASGVIFHNFWTFEAAQAPNQMNHFLKNIALAGALVVIAATPRVRDRS